MTIREHIEAIPAAINRWGTATGDEALRHGDAYRDAVAAALAAADEREREFESLTAELHQVLMNWDKELERWRGPLTDEQCVTLVDRLKEAVCVIGYFDAAIRAAREGAR